MATRERIATLVHPSWVNAVAFSPDGNTLASSLQGFNTVKLQDAATDDVATLEGHTDLVYSVAFSPDGDSPRLGVEGWHGEAVGRG